MRSIVACVPALALLAGVAEAAPRAKLVDDYWTRAGVEAFDHSLWDGFLADWTEAGPDGITLVAYGRVSATGRATLERYLTAAQAVDPTALDREQQFAYWVNLYNAATVARIIEEYPVDSIRDIGGGLFSRGPWDEDAVTVAGRTLSLNDIEHGILRPIWQDARIHYVVNCASIGCPNLGSQAFPADDAEATLDAAARDYVNHPRGARVESGRLIVSSIYEWYGVDFGAGDAGVIAHLRAHAEPALHAALAGVERIHRDEYDWNLNEAR